MQFWHREGRDGGAAATRPMAGRGGADGRGPYDGQTMNAGRRARRRTARAVTAVAVALVLTGTGLASATAKPPPRPPAPRGCEVRTLAMPEDAVLGRVVDIERVPGRGTVYYGSYQVSDGEGGIVQRAVVWYGLDSEPVRVGPTAGTTTEIAFELTASGRINGQSLTDDGGPPRGWVQNLRSGKLTWVDPAPGDDEPDGLNFRRINGRGAGAGTAFYDDGTSVPQMWKRPHKEPVGLPGDFPFGDAWDINNRGEVVGTIAVPVPDHPGVFMPQPTLWEKDGDLVPLVTPTPSGEAFAQLVNDAGQVAGYLVWTETGTEDWHWEAAFWPSHDRILGLGLLPGGFESGAYGLDEGGWVVGFADVVDPENPAAEPWGVVLHSFLWTGRGTWATSGSCRVRTPSSTGSRTGGSGTPASPTVSTAASGRWGPRPTTASSTTAGRDTCPPSTSTRTGAGRSCGRRTWAPRCPRTRRTARRAGPRPRSSARSGAPGEGLAPPLSEERVGGLWPAAVPAAAPSPRDHGEPRRLASAGVPPRELVAEPTRTFSPRWRRHRSQSVDPGLGGLGWKSRVLDGPASST